MLVCRICSRQDIKRYYNVSHGVPKFREKLLNCFPILDYALVDRTYILCEICLIEFKRSNYLRERLLSNENGMKKMIESPAADYQNLQNISLRAWIEQQSVKTNRGVKLLLPRRLKPRMTVPMLGPTPINFISPRLQVIKCALNRNSIRLINRIITVHILSPGLNKYDKRNELIDVLRSLSPKQLSIINSEAAKKCIPTSCKRCKITLKCNHELIYHIALIHQKRIMKNVGFMVKCDICNNFINHQYLTIHMRGHTLRITRISVIDISRNAKGSIM